MYKKCCTHISAVGATTEMNQKKIRAETIQFIIFYAKSTVAYFSQSVSNNEYLKGEK